MAKKKSAPKKKPFQQEIFVTLDSDGDNLFHNAHESLNSCDISGEPKTVAVYELREIRTVQTIIEWT